MNGYHNKSTNDLVRMERNGNPSALLVRLQISTATMENTIEGPQKIKTRNAL